MRLGSSGRNALRKPGQQSEQALCAGKQGFSVPHAEVLCLAARE